MLCLACSMILSKDRARYEVSYAENLGLQQTVGACLCEAFFHA